MNNPKAVLGFVEAKREDIDEIISSIREMASFEHLESDLSFAPKELESELFDQRAAHFLFLEHDGKRIGYMVYFYAFSTFKGHRSLYLEDLYISPSFRHLGFGRLAFQKLASLAKESGSKRIDFVCLSWNENAQKFYSSLGAKAHDEWLLFRIEEKEIEKLASVN